MAARPAWRALLVSLVAALLLIAGSGVARGVEATGGGWGRMQRLRAASLQAAAAAAPVASSSSEFSVEDADDTALLETGDNPLYYDAANAEAFIRAPYLPSTVNGPMYPRTGPQSGPAQAWLAKAAQPAWSALPYGPRTPSAQYVLPFDHMREVQDEFSWNYDYQNPAVPPQFSFAAPIFLESGAQQYAAVDADTDADADSTSEAETVADAATEMAAYADADADTGAGEETEVAMAAAAVPMATAFEVDNLEASLSGSDPALDAAVLAEASSTVAAAEAPQLIPDDFWSARGPSPSFGSYSNPYGDLTNPTLVGSHVDARQALWNRAAAAALMNPYAGGSASLARRIPVNSIYSAVGSSYHQGALPPFAEQIEPFAHLPAGNSDPSAAHVGDNWDMQTFTTLIEADHAQCINCHFE